MRILFYGSYEYSQVNVHRCTWHSNRNEQREPHMCGRLSILCSHCIDEDGDKGSPNLENGAELIYGLSGQYGIHV